MFFVWDAKERVVDFYTLNDLANMLRMDKELTQLKYHRDMISNPGISYLPKDERWIWKPAKLFATHKFHESIFGDRELVKKTLKSIAAKEGMRLDDRQLDLAADWIEAQNSARGIDPVTGKEIETGAERFKKSPVKRVKPFTVEDVEYYRDSSRQKEWGEIADVAEELGRAGVLPIEYRDKVNMLKEHIRELEAKVSAFGSRYENLSNRVQAVSKLTSMKDRLDEIKGGAKESRPGEAESLRKRVAAIEEELLPSLRRFGMEEDYRIIRDKFNTKLAELSKADLTPKERLARRTELLRRKAQVESRIDKALAKQKEKEEAKWRPMIPATYEKGKMANEGELGAFRRLTGRLARAYRALELIKYEENPINWELGEKRILTTQKGEPIQLVVGSGPMPAVSYEQREAQLSSMKRALKKRYINDVFGFGGGVPIGTMEEIAPGLKVPIEGSMAGQASLYMSTGTSPEGRLVRKQMMEEAIKETKLTPDEANQVREAFNKDEVERIKAENAERVLWDKTDLEMAADLESMGSEMYGFGEKMSYEELLGLEYEQGAGTLETYTGEPGHMGITPKGTTWQWLKEKGMTSELKPEVIDLAIKAGKLTPAQAEKIRKATQMGHKEAAVEEQRLREEELQTTNLQPLPSGKLEHPKVAGAKESKLVRAEIALEPEAYLKTTGEPDVAPGQFKITVFQKALTQNEIDTKKAGLEAAREQLKRASKEKFFVPLQDAVDTYPWIARVEHGKEVFGKDSWLEREEFQKYTPKKVWRKIKRFEGVELVEGKAGEKIPSGKADIFYEEPAYSEREYEPGYMVSDYDVVRHDIRRFKAELAGTALRSKGAAPVLADGNLSYVEVPTGRGKPNKLVWRFNWRLNYNDIIKPGDPAEMQLMRSAERIVQDYLKNRSPQPYKGEVRDAGIDYEFEPTDFKTSLEIRGSKERSLREEYKRLYGVEYEGTPITEKVSLAPVFRGKSDQIIRHRAEKVRMSKQEMLDERRLAERIGRAHRSSSIVEGMAKAKAWEKQQYFDTGRVFEPMEKQGGVLRKPKGKAETGRTARKVEIRELQKGWTSAPGGESKAEFNKRVTGELDQLTDKILKEADPPTVARNDYVSDFGKELAGVPKEVQEALISNRVESQRNDPLTTVALSREVRRTIGGLKGYEKKEPVKARALIKEQLSRSLLPAKNSEIIRNHIDNILKRYDEAMSKFTDASPGPDKDTFGSQLSDISVELSKTLEMVRNARYTEADMGIEGKHVEHARNWVQAFDEAANQLKSRLSEERFGIKAGKLVDLTKPEGQGVHDLGPGDPLLSTPEAGVRGMPGEQREYRKEVTEPRVSEFGGVKGVPGEHRFKKKPSELGKKVSAEMDKVVTIDGKKTILPGASSKDIEKALRDGARFSAEAQLDPKMQNRRREVEFKMALEDNAKNPPIRPSVQDKDRSPKKIYLQH